MLDNDMNKLYTVNDIQKIFQLSRTKAYQLMVYDGFPSFRLNKKLYVEHDTLEDWMLKCGARHTRTEL